MLYKGRQVYIQGEPQYEVQYSDRLLERLLEANDPERFGRHHEVHYSLKDLLALDPENLTDEQVKLIVRALERKAAMEEREGKTIEGHAETVEPD